MVTAIPLLMSLVSSRISPCSWSNILGCACLLYCADIVFTGDDAVLPDSAIGNNYLTDFALLQSMGDSLLGDLVDQLGL